MQSISNERYSLSAIQKRIWYVEQLYKNNHFNHLPYVVQMDGELNYQILNSSLNALVQRHKLLRTIFGEEEGIPYQQTLERYNLTVEINEMLNIHKNEEVLYKFVEDEIKKPFDFLNSPPIRVTLIKAAHNKHFLILIVHHIIADGWSIGILLKELNILYTALYDNINVKLPPILQEYPEYIEAKNIGMDNLRHKKATEFWKKKLKDVQLSIDLSFERPHNESDRFGGAMETFFISQELTSKIKQQCRELKVTSFMFLLSCLYLFLFLHSNQRDISIGVPVAGRENKLSEQTVGPYVNIVIFRHVFDGSCSFLDLLRQVREEALNVYEYSDYSYEDFR